MPDMQSRRIAVARDHPAFAGHFPGQPLLPGVVLLGEVLELLLREAPRRSARRLASAR
jgi:3-hydroxymyristoyl/3-hydroxydecanoyl-(acyl carrier protein) dehydratase